ncbi:hypothetical protein JJB59_16285 [Clostridium perfringens]|uniref:hypothetical protein n=1 Tax=Clostridium perfringens TaxID=1502 RepID=UPI001ABAECFB|nr:hypothetical protein [Clostridium perfringens]MBO3424671.1 hypothetical protein [Clostridium perfringens]
MAIALSKMHKRCKKCKYKNICDNKRMVACNIVEIPQTNMMRDITINNGIPNGQPLMRKYTPIKINMGELGKIETSFEKISESLTKDLNKKLGRSDING